MRATATLIAIGAGAVSVVTISSILTALATFLSRFIYQSIAFVELYTKQQSVILKNV